MLDIIYNIDNKSVFKVEYNISFRFSFFKLDVKLFITLNPVSARVYSFSGASSYFSSSYFSFRSSSSSSNYSRDVASVSWKLYNILLNLYFVTFYVN
ncbi:hypothetical protein [Olleya marilimosa]|uniref:Uncharacterized protein n=1 Tax=Olleya marilimosa TaxID=272164 RepID=A0ABR8LUQ2_9FLAO|nr:hypothetical protein [Olleya marilimosa]MBD3863103.1 hypothetical protein [Olleya marilimosa]MBD3890601.1 hypothetical protein [Olleya marilimosa]